MAEKEKTMTQNPLVEMKGFIEECTLKSSKDSDLFSLLRWINGRSEKVLEDLESSGWNLEAIENLIEEAKLTVARADDHGDSYITQPVREALAKLKGKA